MRLFWCSNESGRWDRAEKGQSSATNELDPCVLINCRRYSVKNQKLRDLLILMLLSITAISSMISATREQPSLDLDIAGEIAYALENCEFELTGLNLFASYSGYSEQLSQLKQGGGSVFAGLENKSASINAYCRLSPYNLAP